MLVSCEHGNETLGSIKGGECLVQLSDYQFVNKDCHMRVPYFSYRGTKNSPKTQQ